jgi:tRNA-dihydrouridine synthase A
MMAWTDRHCRFFLRQISRYAQLYTEMITAAALCHGDAARLLAHHETEHPLALQLGGSEPGQLADAARLGAAHGFDEINLNVGCPSDRVQTGRFGACLMAEPALVADCVDAMRRAVDLPVTVKCRIGIDDQDCERDLDVFIDTVAGAGCSTFIIHARKAWLQGLDPKANRTVPPLDHERVYRLKRSRPDLEIILNGGVEDLDECERHLEHVDGAMLGRAAYQNPYLLADVDRRFFRCRDEVADRHEILERFEPYVAEQLAQGEPLHRMTRHALGLFKGEPGARSYRRILSEEGAADDAGLGVLRRAAASTRGARTERAPIAAE